MKQFQYMKYFQEYNSNKTKASFPDKYLLSPSDEVKDSLCFAMRRHDHKIFVHEIAFCVDTR